MAQDDRGAVTPARPPSARPGEGGGAGEVEAGDGCFVSGQFGIAVAQGGSTVMARFAGDDLTVRASISRNSSRRTRLLRFGGPDGDVTLDFAAEPGVVSLNEEDGVCADPAWESRRKPIAQMLDSVNAYFEGGVLDARLGTDAALLGNDLIDAVAESYVRQQIELLAGTSGARGGSRDKDFAYAAREADAIRRRALPQLAHASPLRRLASVHSTH